MADPALAAVVAALGTRQRQLIEKAGRVLWPDTAGMDAAEILSVLRLRGAYDAEIGGFLGAHPDLAQDPAAVWAILALLRTGHHVLTRENVGGLLARARKGTTT